jgi:hypothetical protein
MHTHSIVIPAARPCDWSKGVDINGDNGYAVEIDIREHQGLADINTVGSTIRADRVGRHPGRQLTARSGGTCLVVIGVRRTARVDVGVTVTPDRPTSQACRLANGLASVVEPQLPPAR